MLLGWKIVLVGVLSVVGMVRSGGSASNHQLLQNIGLTRLRSGANHHRKRLAVESRHHGRSDDSHMFIVKLPPNMHYYAHTNAVGQSKIGPGQKLPVGFRNNGKPAKVYHWNLPVVKKVALKQRDYVGPGPNSVKFSAQTPWNEVVEKANQLMLRSRPGHTKPVVKPSYYVPGKIVKKPKGNFKKYFSGNGKPHSFYVLGKKKTPPHYHKLLTA